MSTRRIHGAKISSAIWQKQHSSVIKEGFKEEEKEMVLLIQEIQKKMSEREIKGEPRMSLPGIGEFPLHQTSVNDIGVYEHHHDGRDHRLRCRLKSA